MRFIGVRTWKTSIGTVIAMIIAKELGLSYWVSAGIITILSIQSTKRESLKIAFKRIESVIIALMISSILFLTLGFNSVVFGIYLLIFIPSTVKLKVTDGIVVSSVLVTHLLIEKQVNTYWILNELGLMLVGVLVALALNSYMPKNEEKIKEDIDYISEKIKEIFMDMAYSLRTHSVSINQQRLFNELENRLCIAKKRANDNFNNYLFSDVRYYVNYIEMREVQFQILEYMREHFSRISITVKQTELVANFTEEVASVIGKEVNVNILINRLNRLRKDLSGQELPVTREEFENRAMLFQFLNDLEFFIETKKRCYIK
ncbi:aromatic acid exporter family protein [Clostridium sp. LIBA-8841]|uniref:aromatic acid exporter family protein n=1 Tax=Clostridium sp. LIBA-8841 TaxID=2987530 RepID=UPI002AC666A7|nr:aromatic acid exporter family protein [Clostridium sp. LIBA-8841]MDZ5252470.1 aromatic acid exporter family protein [Clostridium sp. LIBA-8841]